MEEILILGAISDERIALYEEMEHTCRSYAKRVFTPNHSRQFRQSGATDKQIYDGAFQRVREADIVIAELSEQSTVGGRIVGSSIKR